MYISAAFQYQRDTCRMYNYYLFITGVVVRYTFQTHGESVI